MRLLGFNEGWALKKDRLWDNLTILEERFPYNEVQFSFFPPVKTSSPLNVNEALQDYHTFA